MADALQFCKQNSIDGFEDSEATIDFLRKIDYLFDILNSQNPMANNYVTNKSAFMGAFLEPNETILSFHEKCIRNSYDHDQQENAVSRLIRAIDSTIAILMTLLTKLTSPQ